MKKIYFFSAEWRKKDVVFLNSLGGLSKIVEEGNDFFSVEEGETYNRIINHFSQKDSLFGKTKPKDYYTSQSTVFFSKGELEAAKSYTLYLGREKLQDIWEDSNSWKKVIYKKCCESCGLPIGKQTKPWTLKKDFKQFEKYPFVGFEGLGGYVFCSKELANIIVKEFNIGHIEVLVGKKQIVSENLVQLDIPIATQPLSLENSPYGNPYDGHKKTLCDVCQQIRNTNQTLDFFPPFREKFEFDIVLTQEWFGWYRRVVVSRRFINFCFDSKILKKWGYPGVIIPQKNNESS